ncbi:FAD_binding_domain_containing_protein (plasmid) [Leishmania braziliensis MHOM/BR/75/M2904]|uniref:FAD_binding_domain_containing_protein n=1 Tax=Leishmania braziliensis MHOM/BR/75/M2904 TaxID=420245 RepID=A0A3P3YYL6_LEIBR|nr:unnamed protein product [Leishmania braziliensis]SYZ63049.1 FAD_binding_domain_containing_protein [Leishmania braziliensis MHOM/BR/75/M2904]
MFRYTRSTSSTSAAQTATSSSTRAEATRGAGGIVVVRHGQRFMDEMARRDQVRGAMLKRESITQGRQSRHPPLSPLPPHRFGKTMHRDGGTFIMNGLHVNEHTEVLGVTTKRPIPGLHCAGEAAGRVHGKNRLRSNSLLDCVVYGFAAGEAVLKYLLAPHMRLFSNKRLSTIYSRLAIQDLLRLPPIPKVVASLAATSADTAGAPAAGKATPVVNNSSLAVAVCGEENKGRGALQRGDSLPNNDTSGRRAGGRGVRLSVRAVHLLGQTRTCQHGDVSGGITSGSSGPHAMVESCG